MVDFNALMRDTSREDPIHPNEIFEELPKTGSIHDLYQVQAEILDSWYSNREKYDDVVIELNTGGGKTLVGLLIALSVTRETKKGSLYLVENKQLVNQVVEQAKTIGIPAEAYIGRESLDARFDNGEVVLVGSYQAMFNGKSVFGVKGLRGQPIKLGGIIIDDAHASLTALRHAFTISIPAKSEQVTYRKVLAEFEEAFEVLGKQNSYLELYNGEGTSITEIPYEYWRKAESRVSSILLEQSSVRANQNNDFSNSLIFHWPLLKDNLRYCQAIISKDQISISALYPLLDMIPSFKLADRRVYMSATISDYGDMVRSYDLRNLAQEAVIAPKTVSGVGRRMVLFPTAEHLSSKEFQEVICQELDNHHGVVKLAPRSRSISLEQLSFYEPIGHEEVSAAVEALRNQTGDHPVSFANRYNGIDLPDDACRILILEDLPTGIDDVDSMQARYLQDSSVAAQRIAQKIEQGVGRGVRGSSDHCIVLIVGDKLVDWVKRDRNKAFFSPAFQVQIQMGIEISERVHSASDICDVMHQELTSDESWVAFHARVLARHISDQTDRFGKSFEAARLERRVFSQWREGQHESAISSIKKKIPQFDDDRAYQGWLWSIASRIASDANNREKAKQYLCRAHSINPQIENATAHDTDVLPDWALAQAENVMLKLRSIGNAPVLRQFDSDMAGLSFSAPYKELEESLRLLGAYLGFESSREDDNGDGPDVCWVNPAHDIGWVIEAKNEKDSDNPLSKQEAGQLRTACDWLRQKYNDIDVFAVSVHPNALSYKNASPSNLWALVPANLDSLKGDARALISQADCLMNEEAGKELSGVLVSRNMCLRDLANRYLCTFETVD